MYGFDAGIGRGAGWLLERLTIAQKDAGINLCKAEWENVPVRLFRDG
jgi:hypothetical protein